MYLMMLAVFQPENPRFITSNRLISPKERSLELCFPEGYACYTHGSEERLGEKSHLGARQTVASTSLLTERLGATGPVDG